MPKQYNTVPRVCLKCGKEFFTFSTQVKLGKAKYCSLSCTSRSRVFPSVEERFWAKVQKTETCWLWTGTHIQDGYGRFSAHNGKPMLATRYIWELINGPIPPNLCVLHRCDNPPCVNPDHLFLGTKKDNHTDMMDKGRHSHGVKHSQAVLNSEKWKTRRNNSVLK